MNNKQTRTNIILLSLALLLLLFSGCRSLTPKQQSQEENIPPATEEKSEKNEVSLSIDFGNEQSKTFILEFEEEKTVYDLLEELEKQNKIELGTKEYDLGILIEAIDGIKNGQDNKYWLYYLNEQMAPVGVSEQKVSNGDKIEFRFEESKF